MLPLQSATVVLLMSSATLYIRLGVALVFNACTTKVHVYFQSFRSGKGIVIVRLNIDGH